MHPVSTNGFHLLVIMPQSGGVFWLLVQNNHYRAPSNSVSKYQITQNYFCPGNTIMQLQCHQQHTLEICRHLAGHIKT
jgi:hypothetical protein